VTRGVARRAAGRGLQGAGRLESAEENGAFAADASSTSGSGTEDLPLPQPVSKRRQRKVTVFPREKLCALEAQPTAEILCQYSISQLRVEARRRGIKAAASGDKAVKVEALVERLWLLWTVSDVERRGAVVSAVLSEEVGRMMKASMLKAQVRAIFQIRLPDIVLPKDSTTVSVLVELLVDARKANALLEKQQKKKIAAGPGAQDAALDMSGLFATSTTTPKAAAVAKRGRRVGGGAAERSAKTERRVVAQRMESLANQSLAVDDGAGERACVLTLVLINKGRRKGLMFAISASVTETNRVVDQLNIFRVEPTKAKYALVHVNSKHDAKTHLGPKPSTSKKARCSDSFRAATAGVAPDASGNKVLTYESTDEDDSER
jgi:hypothetical protein